MGLCLELCVYVIIYVSIYSDLHTSFYVLYGSLYRVFIQPSILYIYVMRKARIRTILGFLLPKPRIRALCNNPRIAHKNLGSEDLLCKPRIRTQSSRITQPNLGHPRQQTHDRARKAARPSAATWVRCSGWPSCFACAIDRGFFAADGRTALRVRSIVGSLTRMTELLCVCDRSWVCCGGWPRFGCVLPRMAEV